MGVRTWLIAVAIFSMVNSVQGLELQGHRGARGLQPENTLAAFAHALSIGVHTLELDIALTRDKVAVVSHDSHLTPALTRGPGGQWLSGDTPLIRDLSVEELAVYDVGRIQPNSRNARRFPDQMPVDGSRIPRLIDVFEMVKLSGNDRVKFNIETKINPTQPEMTWSVKEMVTAVLGVIREAGMSNRVTLQSFDWRALVLAQQLAPEIPTAYLSAEQSWLDNIQRNHSGKSAWTAGLDIDDFHGSIAHMIAKAGGAIWSPYHKEIDSQKIAQAHKLGLKVIVWTVNDAARGAELIDMGVDGIISDYPDRIRKLMRDRGLELPAASNVIQ